MCNVEPVSGLPYTGPLRLCECTPNQRGCQDPTNRTVRIALGLRLGYVSRCIRNRFSFHGGGGGGGSNVVKSFILLQLEIT